MVGRTGIVLGSSQDLRRCLEEVKPGQEGQCPTKVTVPLPNLVSTVTFASNDSFLLAILDGGRVMVWQVEELVGNNVSFTLLWLVRCNSKFNKLNPFHIFETPHVLDIFPNPADKPDLVAVLTQDGSIGILNLTSKSVLTTFGNDIKSGGNPVFASFDRGSDF